MSIVRIAAVALALGVLAPLPEAFAGPISYSGYTYVGENVHISYTSPLTELTDPDNIYAGAGPIMLNTSSGAIQAFCVDIFDWLQPSGTDIAGTPTLAAADPNFLADASALIGNGLTGSAQAGAAVQVAIWDLEYNGIATPTAGPLSITPDDSNLNALVLADIGKLGSQWLPAGNIEELQAPSGNQSLITVIAGSGPVTNGVPPSVPEPASFAVFAMGLLGLGLVARRGGFAPKRLG